MSLRPHELRAGLGALHQAEPVRFAEHLSTELPGEQWRAARHHRKILDHIRRRLLEGNARIILSMPPRHGKSEMISFWLALWWFTLFPEQNILITSYATSLARGFVRRIRDRLVEHPDVFGVDLRVANEGEVISTEGGKIWAAGVGKGITGTGFNFGICDDLVRDWQQASSPTQLAKIIDWFLAVFYTRRAPGASIVIPMTRWATRDIAGYLEHESKEEWEVIRLPAIAEEGDWLGREPGEALWPERWPVEELNAIKEALTAKPWAGLYKQSPTVESGNVIDVTAFRRWDRLPVPERVIQSWDMSFGSQSDDASYVVGQVWVEAGGEYYLVHQERGRWQLGETLTRVESFALDYPMTTHTLIEDKAQGPSVMQLLRPILINPINIDPKEYGDKRARAVAASIPIARGNVWIPGGSGIEWLGDYLAELKDFPRFPSDDQVDATSQALNWFERQSNRGIWSLYLDRLKRRAA